MAKAKKMYGKYEVEDTAEGRRCVFCGEIKKLVDFPKNGVDSTGSTVYRHDCKTCYNIRRKENRNKNKHASFVGSQRRRGDEYIDFSHQDWKNALIFFGGTCAYCGCTPRKNKRLTKDHLVPLNSGGNTVADNIVPACSSCNSSKGASEFKEWYMKQDFFSQDNLNKIFKWRTIMRQAGGGENDE